MHRPDLYESTTESSDGHGGYTCNLEGGMGFQTGGVWIFVILDWDKYSWKVTK